MFAGLLESTRYKVKQVYSAGNDPLDRGWTRGGEVYHWIPRGAQYTQAPTSSRELGKLFNFKGGGSGQ